MFQRLNPGQYPGIGGTDISVILGLNKYKTPLDLWEEIKGIKEPFQGSLATRIGLALEEQNIVEFSDRTGLDVKTEYGELWDGWYRRSLDGSIADGSNSYVYEGKTSLSFGAKKMWPIEDEGSDGVPDYYQLQVQWYMARPSAPKSSRTFDKAFISALITGPEHRIYTVEKDHETCRRILEFAEHWWKIHVLGDFPPDEKETDCGRGIRERITTGNLVELKENADIAKYKLARTAYDVAKKNLDKEKKNIIKLIGTNDGVYGPWGKMTYKPYTSNRLNRKQLISVLTKHVSKEAANLIVAESCNEVKTNRFQALFSK